MAEFCGVSQLCSGLEAGIDGAVHAIRELFEDNLGSGWGLLLVDAKNAFNFLIKVAALWNVRHDAPGSYSTPTVAMPPLLLLSPS